MGVSLDGPHARFRQILGYVDTTSPRSDWLKWFVFDLATAATTAAAAGVGASISVDASRRNCGSLMVMVSDVASVMLEEKRG